jgi:ribA/ribD-fused uncharacterized protein
MGTLNIVTTVQNYVFFWHKWCPLSLEHECNFEVHGVGFKSVIQYVLFSKAKIYKNHEVAEKIIKADDLTEISSLSTLIRGVNKQDWGNRILSVTTAGCKMRLSQDNDVWAALQLTKGKVLAFANPEEKFWGIGLKPLDSRATNQNEWDGKNHLGNIFMELRDV